MTLATTTHEREGLAPLGVALISGRGWAVTHGGGILGYAPNEIAARDLARQLSSQAKVLARRAKA